MAARIGSIVIEGVEPTVDGGRFPAKRLVGDDVVVHADLLKEGHDVLAGVVRYRQEQPASQAGTRPPSHEWREAPLASLGNDRWEGRFPVLAPGRYAFEVEAWPDLFATWVAELRRKVEAGRAVTSELQEGAVLLDQAAARAEEVSAADARHLKLAAQAVRGGPPEGIAAALDAGLLTLAARHPDRSLSTRSAPASPVQAERARAAVGAWYELFPRSTGKSGTHGTLRDAAAALPPIQEMGFDIVYLPPIHPIGRTNRKGKNNRLEAGADDVGSPWAIGSPEGGHKAVHPQLGGLDAFRFFHERAEALGLEVALDLAYQCSPDHPYLREHPEWFHHRPDGTIKTAENPPKRYEDIVNFDFTGPARESLWAELRSIVLFWIDQGVRLFRVDNPHTKPLPFWAWLIPSVLEEHPDVVFLSEAFTRPKMMKGLAKAGFSQSYTYFTWRNGKEELRTYLEEITRPPVSDYFRGNLWPNTPDILPELLQHGGPSAFKLRVALAATLSSSYGIYQGFELCESRAVPGTEEYLDSEKYELKQRDLQQPGNLRDYLRALNRMRHAHPAFLRYENLRFTESGNDRILTYARRTDDGSSCVLAAVSLDPYAPQETAFTVPLAYFGLGTDETYEVTELLSGSHALWQGEQAHVVLSPESPAAFWSVRTLQRSESSFDYF